MKNILCSAYRKTRPSRARVLPCVALLLLTAACAPRQAPSLTEASSRHDPIKMASGVPARPGALAWSPDGKRLAFINKTVTIADAESGARKTVLIQGAHYLAWAADNALFALSRDGGKETLCMIDAGSLAVARMPLDREADALYPEAEGTRLHIISIKTTAMQIGTQIAYTIDLHDRMDGTAKTVYTFDRIYPAKNLNRDLLQAWTHAGLNPLDNSLLIIEHVKPPVFQPHSRVTALDCLTGRTTEISDQERRNIFVSASWSPDGRRLALTDTNGRLEIQTLRGDALPLDGSPVGFYPSWNPKGSRIFTGGDLIDADGRNREPLLRNDPWSISQWSPDGTSLAVISQGELMLFTDFSPSFAPPDRPLDRALADKLSLLQTLFREGLITAPEYRERRAGLLKEPEDLP